MEVQLSDDQKALLRQAVEAGRYPTEADALSDAVSLWENRERRRAEILAAVDLAEASFTRGEGRRVSSPEGATKLADEIKARGLTRLKQLKHNR